MIISIFLNQAAKHSTTLLQDGALKKSMDAAGCGGLLKDGSERWI